MILEVSRTYIDHWKLKNMVLFCRVELFQMMKPNKEVRIANDGEDGDGLRYGFLKSRQRFKLKFGLKIVEFCKNVAAVWTFFKKLLLII